MAENEITTTEAVNQYDSFIRLAIESNADLDKIERLMALKERYDQKEAEKSFKAAMVQFQAEKPAIKKTSQVDFTTKTGTTNYKFASLPSIQVLVDPILSKFGLSYTWKQKQTEAGITMTCILSHVDGHSEENTLSAPNDNSGGKNAIQSIGSTVSYLKRYTLEGATGLSSDKDVDGNIPKKPKTKVELLPETELWEQAVTALTIKSVTIQQIEKLYILSDENRTELLNQAI